MSSSASFLSSCMFLRKRPSTRKATRNMKGTSNHNSMGLTVNPEIIAPAPKDRRMSQMLLPIMSPTAMPVAPLLRAIMAIVSSGMPVPRPTISRPVTDGGMAHNLAS